MNKKKIKYVIISEDESCYLSNLYDFNGDKKYDFAGFDTNFNTAKQFSSKKISRNWCDKYIKVQ